MKTNPSMHLVDLDAEIKLVPIRNGYGEGLVLAGDKNKNVVVLCADLSESTRSLAFQQKYPGRFVEVGVAEQNMASLAAGMAMAGKVPFISSYAMFSPGRNWEQIRTTICYNDVGVKIGGAHAGISVGPDGATHQAVEDIAIMRVIPNMTVLVPCDAIECRKATIAAAEYPGPVYIRFAREKTAVVTSDATPFSIGKAEVFVEGADVAIVAAGTMVYEALVAARDLEKEGVSAAVINCASVKPLDTKTILEWARKCGCMVTAEEHQISGGLGSAVSEFLAGEYPIPIKRIGVKNLFGQSGAPEELMKLYGLKAQNIVQAAKCAVKLKYSGPSENVPAAPRGEQASRLSERAFRHVPAEIAFKTRDGKIITNLPQLHKAVLGMENSTFKHHVHGNKNDFAQWIADIHQDNDLAYALRKATTKASVACLLGARLGQLARYR